MTDPDTGMDTGMYGHVAMTLRLVYEADPSPDQPLGGWTLVGVLPEHALPGEAGSAGKGNENDGLGQVRRRVVSEGVGLRLDRDEAEGYYLNLTSPEPSLFVLLRQPDIASAGISAAGVPAVDASAAVTPASCAAPEAEAVTASYSEAARWMDGGMVVVRTPLPEPMLPWLAEFAQHHFQVAGKKRGRFRPSFLTRQEFGEAVKVAQEEAGQVPDTVPDCEKGGLR